MSAADTATGAAGAPAAPVGGPRARRFLPVLAYHSFSGARHRRDELCTSVAALDGHLARLTGAGYTVVGLTEALGPTGDPAGGPAEAPAAQAGPTVALTVDDGYADFLDAVEVLHRYRARATLYVPAGHLGGTAAWLGGVDARRRLLTARQLRELAAAGVEIGAHGWDHRALDVVGPATLATETDTARRHLREELGVPVSSFAYPFGYADRRARRAVAAAGYANACVLGHTLHRRGADPHAVRRLLVTAADDDGGTSLLRRCRTAVVSARGVVTSSLQLPWRGYRRLTTAKEHR